MPDRGLHDVHDDRSEIDQDPFAAVRALDAVNGGAERLEFFLYVAGERPVLPRRIAAHHYQFVEKRRHVPHVKYHDIAPLEVFKRGDGGGYHFVEFHQSPRYSRLA